MKPVAVLGCAIEVQAPSEGLATITSMPATDAFVDNKGIYFGTLMISVSGATVEGATAGEGTGTLMGTSQNCTNNGQSAVLEGDSAMISVTGETTSTPPSSITWTLQVKITNAGQTSVMVD